MHSRRFLERVPKRLRLLSCVLGLFLGPCASLMAAASGCAGSRCQMTCNETALCMTGGCFHDGKDKCDPYQNASGWTTTWPLGSTIHCDEILDASNSVIGVTCKGTDGEAAGESCTCNFVYTTGTKQCG